MHFIFIGYGVQISETKFIFFISEIWSYLSASIDMPK